ncbi:4584_t:CDS:2 [Gigaspora margarita]|uniref:4584_t:CDS:1 n=1 Tax=Gigaspora margarita TaxID=4874 RepID=A0ABN7VDX7_GIGMA|nr:4584_t:CDS:2 [Gigaspora margarita]
MDIKIKEKGLKDSGFHRAALLSLELWQNLGHTWSEGEELIAQMRQFDTRLLPSTLPYVLGVNTPKIWWGLEGMSKIRSYYMTNIQCELNFADKKLTEADL